MTDITYAQIVALRNGLDPVLSSLQAVLTNAFLQSLPIVGTKLADTAKTEVALQQYLALETGIVKALDALNDPAGYAAAALTNSINGAITRAGFSGNAVVVVSPDGRLSVQLMESASMSYSQPLGANFGIPNLSVQTSGTAGATIGYSVDLGATVDASNGFSLVQSTAPALDVSLALSAPSFTTDAAVGPIEFRATDNGTSLSGDFKLDTAGKATFTGDATLGLHLKSDLGSGALPSISADLAGTWQFDAAAINPADPADFGSRPTIGFNNVTYDLGSFFDTFLKPVLDKIAPVLAPIHTALAVFNTDLTFIKGLFGPAWHALDVAGGTDAAGNDTGDGRITLLDFLKAGLTLAGHPQNVGTIQSFLNTLDKVVDLAAYLDNVQLGPASYNLGSFNIGGDLRQQGFNAANAAIHVLAPGQDITSVLKSLGGAYAAQAPGSTQATSDKLIGVLNDPTFAFPILTPTNAFALLLGGATDLFDFTPPAVGINLGSIAANGAPTNSVGPIATIPIFPGIELDVNAALDASLALGFGYDTKGLTDYSNGGYSDPGKLLDGLFISNPANGQPVLRVAGDVSLALNFGVPGTNVGGGGDIGGDVEFSLPGTGKAYLGPFLGSLASDPLSALDATGKITAGFDAGVNIAGINVYTYNSPRLTLASFNHQVTPQAGPATTVVTGVAVSAIDDDTAVTTGIETPGHVIRFTLTFSNAVVLDPNTTTLTLHLNDNGATTISTKLTKAAGSNQVVFEYRVLPSETTIKLLGIQSVSGTVKDINGNAVDASAAVNATFGGLGIDTSAPREFTAPTGDFNAQSSFNRAFVAVSAGGQDLLLYGNAIVDSGSTATFHQDSADVTTLVVQPGGALDMQRGVLRINGGLTESENRGTITVEAAQLSLKGNLTNYGILALGAAAGTPTFTVLQDTNTLSGGGKVLLSDSDANLIGGGPAVGNASGLPVLVNADNTISGAGTIGGYAANGSSGLDLVNKSLIAGTGTHQLRLLATTTNLGTLSGTGTGGLAILTTVDNTKGTIAASGGGLVTLGDKADVAGGTLSTPGGTDTARITTAGTAAIHGPITLNAFLAVGDGARLEVTGTVVQAHYALPGANTARLSAGGGVLELQSGAILSGGYLTTGAGGLVSVTGSATLGGGGGNTTSNGLGLLTDASIQVAAGTSLAFQGGVINRGTVTAAGGVVVYGTLDNAGGTITATGAGDIALDSSSTVQGGTLVGPVFAQGSATLDGTASSLRTLGVLTARATVYQGVSYGLQLKGVIDQYGDASTAGSIIADNVDVTLQGATLKNGTLQTVGTGRFVLNGASVLDGTSHGLQLPGTVTVQRNGRTTIRGDIVNKGSITLDGSFSAGQQAVLAVSGTATLSGGGSVVLESSDNPYSDRAGVITGAGTAGMLDNHDNTISGYGYIGLGALGFSNEKAGVLDATTTTLTLQTANGVNRGLIEATTGTLVIQSVIDNAGGRIVAADGALVLGGGGIAASIAGGTLAATGAGTIHVQAGQSLVLDGTSEAVTLDGTLHVDRAATTTIKGAIANTGAMSRRATRRGRTPAPAPRPPPWRGCRSACHAGSAAVPTAHRSRAASDQPRATAPAAWTRQTRPVCGSTRRGSAPGPARAGGGDGSARVERPGGRNSKARHAADRHALPPGCPPGPAPSRRWF